MEFACKVAGSKIITVLGHTNCGAIKGACDHVEMGNLTTLLSKIRPAIDDELTVIDERHSGNEEFVGKVTLINVRRAMQGIVQRSPILKEMLEREQILLVGGIHNIASGEVTFYSNDA
jgi:carbonic anhydrase